MHTSSTFDIATHTATGRRYVVRAFFPARGTEPARVRCWGEVASFRLPGATTHREDKLFTADAVTIERGVARSFELLRDLFEQGLEDLEERGWTVTRSARGNARLTRPAFEISSERTDAVGDALGQLGPYAPHRQWLRLFLLRPESRRLSHEDAAIQAALLLDRGMGY